jgi:hypothetical protein
MRVIIEFIKFPTQQIVVHMKVNLTRNMFFSDGSLELLASLAGLTKIVEVQ